MTGIEPQAQRFVVMALDRATGKVVWEKVAAEATPPEGTHPDGTWASASPITDGEMLYAHFGSNGLFAYDPGPDIAATTRPTPSWGTSSAPSPSSRATTT